MPSPSSPKTFPTSEIRAIDALFEQAGLVHHRRRSGSIAARQLRFDRAAQEELSEVAPAPRVAANGVQWLDVPGWEKMAWLWHGFSTRKGGESRAYCPEDAAGELNLGFTADDERETVMRNRQLLAEAVTGDAATTLVTVRQVHSKVIVVARAAEQAPSGAKAQADLAGVLRGLKPVPFTDSSSSAAGRAVCEGPAKGDGLMTGEPGLLLAIQTADCIPVLVADKKRHVVAAFHAGWRGTVNRIVESGIGRMRLEFGCRPEDLVAAIGPGVGSCCYAVGEEVLSSFESQFAYGRELFREVYSTDEVRAKYPMLFLTQRAPGHSPMGPSLHLDLKEANRRQLLAAGLRPRAIQSVGGCTNCQPELFFSHRASQGRAGRMLSVIGIRGRAFSRE